MFRHPEGTGVTKGDFTMAFDRAGFERAVGILLQAARSKRGMTQEELAEAIGVPRASYANVEAGRQRIPADIVFRAAAVLGVSVHSLFPEAIYRPKQAAPQQNTSNDATRTTSQDLTALLTTPSSVLSSIT
jgi:transcriptional regulator with XRE-family HTH domain